MSLSREMIAGPSVTTRASCRFPAPKHGPPPRRTIQSFTASHSLTHSRAFNECPCREISKQCTEGKRPKRVSVRLPSEPRRGIYTAPVQTTIQAKGCCYTRARPSGHPHKSCSSSLANAPPAHQASKSQHLESRKTCDEEESDCLPHLPIMWLIAISPSSAVMLSLPWLLNDPLLSKLSFDLSM